MLRSKLTLCFVSAILLVALCARAAEQKYAKYDDPKGRFHMDHPEDWKKRDPNSPNVVIAFLHERADFGDNVNIVSTQLPAEMSEDDLDKAIKQVLPQQIPGFHLISDEPEEVTGHHVHRMVYTATIQNHKLQFTQVGLISGKTNYTITFTTLPERQEELKPIIDHVLKSFKLEEKGK